MSVQRELTTNTVVEVSYLGSKITHIGIPDSNINQLTEDQLKLGPTLLERVPNPYFGIIPRSSSIGDPTITRAQLMKPLSGLHRGQLLSEQCRARQNYQGLAFSIRQRLSRRPDLLGRLYPLEADRHRLVGVRRVDSDWTADERAPSRTATIWSATATTRPETFRTTSPPRSCGIFRSGQGRAKHPDWRGRRAGERLERRHAS